MIFIFVLVFLAAQVSLEHGAILTFSKNRERFFFKKNSTLQNKSLYFTEKSTPPAEPLF